MVQKVFIREGDTKTVSCFCMVQGFQPIPSSLMFPHNFNQKYFVCKQFRYLILEQAARNFWYLKQVTLILQKIIQEFV